MVYSGNAITVQMLSDGIAEFRFNLQTDYLQDFEGALNAIKATPHIQGIWLSAQSLLGLSFDCSASHAQQIITSFSQLPIPKVATLEHQAIGGGAEILLACDYRILTPHAKIAFPDLTYGMTPFLGGTVRLPHLVGLQIAIDWFISSNLIDANTAFKNHFAQTLVTSAQLKDAALHTLKLAITSKLNWQQTQRQQYSDAQKILQFHQAKQSTLEQFPLQHYPSYKYLIDHLKHSLDLSAYDALKQELAVYEQVKELPQTQATLHHWHNLQQLKKEQKQNKRYEHPIQKVALFGEITFAPFIAQQGMTCYIQDINALQNAYQATPVQHWNFLQPKTTDLKQVDIIFECSNTDIKQRKYQLENIEHECHRNTILVVQLKDYSLEKVSVHLQHKHNLVGLHALDDDTIELVKTSQTSDICIATVSAFLQRLGKQVFVVKDAQGFFIRRVAKAYLDAYSHLLQQGITTEQIHQQLNQFGWNTTPEQWATRFELYTTITPYQLHTHIKQDDVNDMMMVALCNEAIRCLEKGIVQSPAQLDVMTIEILGFPTFKSGVYQYIQTIGIAEYLALCDKYSDLGEQYKAPAFLLEQQQEVV